MAKAVLKKVLASVVKIYCTFTRPNFSLPWQMERQSTCTSSGFLIPGKRILCNAHGIAFQSSVRVRKHGDSTKYTARVLHVGHECDLAILHVDSEHFWEGMHPLNFGKVPNLQDEVICVGYPTGGDNISVTQGIVSRVAVGKYTHGDESLLAIQIDAAINAGNSGGPALKGNSVIGVAFQTLENAENIGYIIPVPVIEHFLVDIDRFGQYRGFCILGIHSHVIENKGMQKALKVKNGNGILVTKIAPLSDCTRVMKVNDVILAFDGVSIAGDGTVVYRDSERVAFSHLVSSKFVKDTVTLKILREGKQKKVKVVLNNRVELVKSHMHDMIPSYYIYAGFVFTVVSYPFLVSEYGPKWDKKCPIDLCEMALYGLPTQESEEVVVINQVLINEVNIGYEHLGNAHVKEANGIKIYNLRQLVKIIQDNTGPFLRLNLSHNHIVIIDTVKAKETHSSILKMNNIAETGSNDLKSIIQPIKPNAKNNNTITLNNKRKSMNNSKKKVKNTRNKKTKK